MRFIRSFLFYKEETLTTADCILYKFLRTKNFPIGISTTNDDLELFVDWWVEGVEGVREILEGLQEIGALNLNIGYDMDTVLDELKDQPLYFNKTLAEYFTIDLSPFETTQSEIKYDNFRLTDKRIHITQFLEFLPEFILDFGEMLEEKKTPFWIGSHGIIADESMTTMPDRILSEICSAYATLENLEYVLEHFDPLRVRELFENHIRHVMRDELAQISFDIGPLENTNLVLSYVKRNREKMLENYNFITVNYSNQVFFNWKVYMTAQVTCTFEDSSSLCSIGRTVLEKLLMDPVIPRVRRTLKGFSMFHPGNVSMFITAEAQPSLENQVVIDYKIFPQFGD